MSHSGDKSSPRKKVDLIFGKYELETKIGEGSFGKIYSGMSTQINDIAVNVQTNEHFALKIENKKTNHLLEAESHILFYLKGEEGIPQILSYGYSGEQNVLVMELLGPSLSELLEKNNGTFSLKTVCLLAYQIVYIFLTPIAQSNRIYSLQAFNSQRYQT